MLNALEITLQLHPFNDGLQAAWLCTKLQGLGTIMVQGFEQHEGVFVIRLRMPETQRLLQFLQSLPEVSEVNPEPVAPPNPVTLIHIALKPVLESAAG